MVRKVAPRVLFAAVLGGDRRQTPVVHHDAAVLDDLDTGGAKTLGRRAVFDPELHPHRSRGRLEVENLVHMGRDLIGCPKKIDDIDTGHRLGERQQTRMRRLAENFGQLGIDGDDPVPLSLHVEGNSVGVVALALFDSHYRNGSRRIEKFAEVTVVLVGFHDCVSPPVGRTLARGPFCPIFPRPREFRNPRAGVERRR